ncbi:hypothetical protein [Tenggerimyces flavus]|uniref:Uncharacterized protein n=1 Tax=Tenggerimyces flavus TaxID=1708749 RepID=A0ABV7YFK0_9ACTN|nr:hypothetical protein [Tenggerimyces flavus]MBM7784313.1 hypothetical protein [Tenggerimyces flavus]
MTWRHSRGIRRSGDARVLARPLCEPLPWPRGLPYGETVSRAIAGTPVVVVWEFELL